MRLCHHTYAMSVAYYCRDEQFLPEETRKSESAETIDRLCDSCAAPYYDVDAPLRLLGYIDDHRCYDRAV